MRPRRGRPGPTWSGRTRAPQVCVCKDNGVECQVNSVAVQSVSTGIESVLEVALVCVVLSCGPRRIEHAQNRQPEAHRIEATQLDVAAVAIGRVSAPALA